MSKCSSTRNVEAAVNRLFHIPAYTQYCYARLESCISGTGDPVESRAFLGVPAFSFFGLLGRGGGHFQQGPGNIREVRRILRPKGEFEGLIRRKQVDPRGKGPPNPLGDARASRCHPDPCQLRLTPTRPWSTAEWGRALEIRAVLASRSRRRGTYFFHPRNNLDYALPTKITGIMGSIGHEESRVAIVTGSTVSEQQNEAARSCY